MLNSSILIGYIFVYYSIVKIGSPAKVWRPARLPQIEICYVKGT